ncbi:Transcription factor 20 [Triplophysa tibetana]|uniref:Transcription factor 20 n=1 Tax=Triplophysa tibetana TaxID=1572043 RepID=A0A5A9PUY1_9TELE|nr:Transcription factor 20 [Triplophysa tibetana]
MEQPPSNSESFQPQDLSSTCSLPNIFDLSKNGEDALLKANPLDALHVVQRPGWFVSPGTSNGLLLPENDADALPLPPDQIQPDNAFSNTTVTLSYVSRSQVFSNPNALSDHSPIYAVPPLSKAFVLHPPTIDATTLAADTGDAALSLDMDQHCLQQVSLPVGLTACDQFRFMSPAQVVENVAALCYLQQHPDLSGLQDVENIALEKLKSLQQTNPADCRFPINLAEFQNGAANCLWNIGPFEEGFTERHDANAEGLHRNGNPEVVFLFSRSEEPVMLPNNQGTASFPVSLNQDFISPLDPASPPAASVDEIDEVFSLAQGSSSPSGKNSVGREMIDAEQEHLSREEFDPETSHVEKMDSHPVSEFITSTNEKHSGNTDKACHIEPVQVNGISEGKTDTLETTGGSLTKKTLERKKLPPRARRGMRLGAIVQNIRPTRYKSSHVTNIQKAQASKISHLDVSSNKKNQHMLERVCTATVESNDKTTVRLQKEETNDKTTVRLQKEETNDKTSVLLQKEETDVLVSPRCKTTVSTSCLKNKHIPKPSLDHKPTKNFYKDVLFGSKKRLRKNMFKKPLGGTGNLNSLPTLQTSRKSSPKPIWVPAAGNKPHASKRKRKKPKLGHTCPFAPQEPEIKLKCLSYKGERKDVRNETFAPYVHGELQEIPSCTVVNCPEESFRLKHGKRQVTDGSVSGMVPVSPCLQYGRVSMDGTQRGALVCCLCEGSANAMELGDLHGPYYPEGFTAASRTLSSPHENEEDHSDSDSFFCPKRGKWVGSSWTKSLNKLSESPNVKRQGGDAGIDWYSPPVVPLDGSEYWLHEDCGIWSAGVFLVKGKLYGLENAVKLAKVSICSTCQDKGATLGCVFKGCPNKYHFTCAMQSGCVLNEENFSMKCRKHKNKFIK